MNLDLTFAAVGLLLDEVVPGPEGDQVGVVGGGGDGHRPGAPHVGVAQLVGQLLQLIGLKPEHDMSKEMSCIIMIIDLLSSQRTW